LKPQLRGDKNWTGKNMQNWVLGIELERLRTFKAREYDCNEDSLMWIKGLRGEDAWFQKSAKMIVSKRCKLKELTSKIQSEPQHNHTTLTRLSQNTSHCY
jgi:hypothetical protein